MVTKAATRLGRLRQAAERAVLDPIRAHTIDPDTLHFGQQHVHTHAFFDEDVTVPITDTPHYAFVTDDADPYRRYLERSWEYYDKPNTAQGRADQVVTFADLIDDIAAKGIHTPVRYYERVDGDRIIIDGNHRAATAAAFGYELPAVEVGLSDYLGRNASNPGAFYGTAHRGRPYTSIYYDGEELVRGRRRDIRKRHALIDRRDLAGKRVLDMGCNIGAASLLAAREEATVTGIDVNPDLVTTAIRNAVALAQPCQFTRHDLATPLDHVDTFETAFAFAIDAHVDNDPQLARNIAANVSDVLYFETHRGSDIPDAIRDVCSTIDVRGTTGPHDGRQFYRCEL